MALIISGSEGYSIALRGALGHSTQIRDHQRVCPVIKGHQGSSGVIARTFETMNESVPTLGGEALLYMPKGELPSRFVVACIA